MFQLLLGYLSLEGGAARRETSQVTVEVLILL